MYSWSLTPATLMYMPSLEIGILQWRYYPPELQGESQGQGQSPKVIHLALAFCMKMCMLCGWCHTMASLVSRSVYRLLQDSFLCKRSSWQLRILDTKKWKDDVTEERIWYVIVRKSIYACNVMSSPGLPVSANHFHVYWSCGLVSGHNLFYEAGVCSSFRPVHRVLKRGVTLRERNPMEFLSFKFLAIFQSWQCARIYNFIENMKPINMKQYPV